MLQDLSFGKLENQYKNILPRDEDTILCFRNRDVLMLKASDGSVAFPKYNEISSCTGGAFRYVFTMQDTKYFLYMFGEIELSAHNYTYIPVSELRKIETKDACFAVMTALHLNEWYRKHRYCGCCAHETAHDDKERMLYCPNCGNMIFPVICPAVIIALTDGDRLLLSKYAGRSYSRYALLAGYTEIGETLEQTVEREVMEEVGLKVKNIRYYKSQPWGVDGSVLMGFYCDLSGDDTIHLDETELSLAQWHNRYSLPAHDDGISLTREMIRIFEEGKEPK